MKLVHRLLMGRDGIMLLLLLATMLLSSLYLSKVLFNASCITGRVATLSHVNVSVVLPYAAWNRSAVMESIERWVRVGCPCKIDRFGIRQSSKVTQLIFYVNAEVTSEDHKLVQWARERLGGYSSCFSRIFAIGAELTPEDDIYPSGPSNMFFKVFHDPRLQIEFRSSNHMFWMEPDVYPLRAGWLDILVQEASKGNFWISGSAYLGDGLNDAVTVPENWNWIGHINGNSLYNLRDDAFKEFLRLVVQYEPPNHFWKPFDVSIWRVIHSFPYTWPIYQKYRSKFVHSHFINHWGFHISPREMSTSIAQPDVFFAHGSAYSAGNLLLRPKPVPAGVIWNDRVPKSSRLSIFICNFVANVAYSFEAAMSALKFVPDAFEVVVVVPSREVFRFQEYFSTSTLNAVRIVGESETFKDGQVQQTWSNLHADKYCHGDIILHMPYDSVLNRELQLRDLMWLDKPILIYQRFASNDAATLSVGAEISHTLGSQIHHDFSCSLLHIYPRDLYSLARNHLNSLHQTNVSDFLIKKVEQANDIGKQWNFCEFNYLGAFARTYTQDMMSMVPLDPDESSELLLPPPIIQVPLCQGSSKNAQTPALMASLLQSLSDIRKGGLPCHRVLKIP